ncbi:MAG: hypothetical protein J6B53_03670, partial [Clostridia bacterium]|nr:hypothetical protein [Clostridia bacterium]
SDHETTLHDQQDTVKTHRENRELQCVTKASGRITDGPFDGPAAAVHTIVRVLFLCVSQLLQ